MRYPRWSIVRPAISVDARALGFALAISIGAALVFGLIPALYVARADVNEALKEGGRASSASLGRTRVWSLLVAGEVALASMLLVGAGLAMKSFVNLQHVNPGIRPDHVLTFRMRLPTDNLYKGDREQAAFYRRVLDKVEQIPGIQSAGLTDVLPLGQQNDREYFTIEKRPLPPGQELVADFRRISPLYLNTMGIALLRGRLLSDRDVADAPQVILIDETLAHQYWPNENPIGRRMRLWGEFREVVGIVGQVHHYGLEKQPEPTIYAPYEQMPDKAMALAVRTTMDTQAVVKAVKQAVWSVDRGQPVFQIRSMDDYMSLADTAPRISTILLLVFAGISMLLAALGIHGVVSYGVAQRTREFGLRMALGSTPGQLKALVIQSGIRTALIGLLAGMAGAAALASALRALLFGVAPLDPGVMAGVAALLLPAGAIAKYLPAWRASPRCCLRWRWSRTPFRRGARRASIRWKRCTTSRRIGERPSSRRATYGLGVSFEKPRLKRAQNRVVSDFDFGWGRPLACGGLSGRQRALARLFHTRCGRRPWNVHAQNVPINDSCFRIFVLQAFSLPANACKARVVDSDIVRSEERRVGKE